MERPAHAKPHLQIILQNKALEQILKKGSVKENLAPNRETLRVLINQSTRAKRDAL